MLPHEERTIIDALDAMTRKPVEIETTEGVTRRGILTTIRWRDLDVGRRTGERNEFVPELRSRNSRKLRFPYEFVLDNDQADPIPFATVRRIDLGLGVKVEGAAGTKVEEVPPPPAAGEQDPPAPKAEKPPKPDKKGKK